MFGVFNLIIDSAGMTALNSDQIHCDWLIWITAKQYGTYASQSFGACTHSSAMSLNVGGNARTYMAGGGILAIDDIVYTSDMNVQTQSISFSGINSGINDAVRMYDCNNALIDIHLAIRNSAGAVVSLVKVFDGFIDKIAISDNSGSSSIDLELVSSFRNSTRPLYLTKSHSNQKLRNPADTGRKYTSLSSNIAVFWGSKSQRVNSK